MTETSIVDSIRDHYDRLLPYYHSLWGEHIHHGYWKGDESPAEAQVHLIEMLASRAGIQRNTKILDVGCGIGGSSLWLAGELGCEVLGITISPKQAAAATDRARQRGLSERARFEVKDANQLDLPSESFDAIWVIEASEHLTDKPGFIRECARVLKPGGVLAICAWVAAEQLDEPRGQLVEQVCQGMLCPSMASLSAYTGWMEQSGFQRIEAEDIVLRVKKTWKLCARIARRPEVQLLLKTTDQRTRDFVKAFAAIDRAYEEGAMGYGMLHGTKASQ